MGFFQDMIAVFKKRELVFIESYKESKDVYTFVFEKEKDLTWKAGQHGLFSITHKKIKNPTKPFTIASAPSENVVRLTMKINDNPSDFKKAMVELKQGMTIGMSGPLGSLNVNDERPTILIAGGIGITPFRSIVKQIEAEGDGNKKPIHLLYMDSEKSYIFKDELDAINGSISTMYLDSRDKLHQEIDKFSNLYQNNGQYMIAGPKSMVDSISSYLQNNSISKKNIKKDAFYGY
ncbi:FAD-dependent oxidoreductase [Fredinandcohnia sp. QZ13]|uniref:FAD-dependent oxidoreductase n=1 Tax=Fredinandcohnia sp. QZ13 TaxID=3073144 RepID=UPI00285356B6|nr:FAD-dependent oxidoreductase [Fredinandcohnia sp. QZ13]MDR4887898.1 FAD-dependent oxidoreductase [Fredinandcohnia sp. QZ13]